MNHPVQKVVDSEWPFILQMNVSDCGFCTVLCQEDDSGQEHPVTFQNWILFPCEIHYSVIEKDYLGSGMSTVIFQFVSWWPDYHSSDQSSTPCLAPDDEKWINYCTAIHWNSVFEVNQYSWRRVIRGQNTPWMSSGVRTRLIASERLLM